jgi:hypothetical protein
VIPAGPPLCSAVAKASAGPANSRRPVFVLWECRRRVKTGPPAPGEKWAAWACRPVAVRAWARLRRASSGGPRWWGWSSGPRSVAGTSLRVCRSARFIGGRGCIATRSARRSTAASRRSIAARRRGRSSIRLRMRSTGCWVRSPSCRAFGSASCSSRWAARPQRRSSMSTCARCGRCFLRHRGRFSARSTGRARSVSSTSGSRARRCRSATVRRAAAGS